MGNLNKGSYLLLLYLPKKQKIQIGKLGSFHFNKGYYCYVGSAMNNMELRIKRHLKKEKKLHWHIDYLRPTAEVIQVYRFETEEKIECILNQVNVSHLPTSPGSKA